MCVCVRARAQIILCVFAELCVFSIFTPPPPPLCGPLFSSASRGLALGEVMVRPDLKRTLRGFVRALHPSSY
jgi:hypothetical protein